MTEEKTDTKESKDLLSRLRDAGDDALQRVADMPGGQKVLDAMNGLRDRIDELQKRLGGVDELEKRVEALEKKIAGSAKTGTRKTDSTS